MPAEAAALVHGAGLPAVLLQGSRGRGGHPEGPAGTSGRCTVGTVGKGLLGDLDVRSTGGALGEVLHEGKLTSLKRFKDDAIEVLEGFECGIGVDGFNDFNEGDVIEVYEIKEVKRSLV